MGAAQGRGKNYETYLNLTKMLIARGADVNLKLRSGRSDRRGCSLPGQAGRRTLHGVARSYSEVEASEVCSILIQAGARINEQNVRGHTPLDEALLPMSAPKQLTFFAANSHDGEGVEGTVAGEPRRKPACHSIIPFPAESE